MLSTEPFAIVAKPRPSAQSFMASLKPSKKPPKCSTAGARKIEMPLKLTLERLPNGVMTAYLSLTHSQDSVMQHMTSASLSHLEGNLETLICEQRTGMLRMLSNIFSQLLHPTRSRPTSSWWDTSST